MVLPVYYEFPFSEEGDTPISPTVVPNTGSVSGSISYQRGYTPPYQQQLGDPGALPVSRADMNQLFYDVTSNVKQYQDQGTAPWHPASDNGGSSIEYPLYARVVHNGLVYESQIDLNTNTPGVGQSWRVISGSTVAPGTVIDFAGATPPDGYLACDGAIVSQTTYAALYAAIGDLWHVDAGAGDFNVPDLRSRVTVGSGITLPPLSGNTVGTKGGSSSTSELVNHTHTATVTGDNNAGTGDGNSFFTTNRVTAPHSSSITLSTTGTGATATIVQPSAVVMKCIKY